MEVFFYVMEEKFRLELLSMIDRFADDNTVMMIDGCVCRLLRKYDINEKHTELCVLENENEKILNTYRASLRLEGRSPSTIYQYMDSIKHTLDDLGNKNIKDIAYHILSRNIIQKKEIKDKIQIIYDKNKTEVEKNTMLEELLKYLKKKRDDDEDY